MTEYSLVKSVIGRTKNTILGNVTDDSGLL